MIFSSLLYSLLFHDLLHILRSAAHLNVLVLLKAELSKKFNDSSFISLLLQTHKNMLILLFFLFKMNVSRGFEKFFSFSQRYV